MRPLTFLAGLTAGAWLIHERRARQHAVRFAAAALESLLKAIDANDQQTGAHVRRVATYALIIADALDVDEEERRSIELAALFHDIGKIHEALFDIVHEPRQLTPEERRAVATHPTRGAQVLAPIAHFHRELAEAVLAHHERWDGTGYPRGLRAGRIPLAARVVSLADSFDAMTHNRRYRHGQTTREAIANIARGRGTQFDPLLVDLVTLPPVFDALSQAHRESWRGRTQPNRRDARGVADGPNVSFRWRSRSEPPISVREKMADTRDA